MRAFILKNGGMTGGNLQCKTSLHLALEINDFRPSYIIKIMDLTDMCPGKGILHTVNTRV